MAKKLFLALGLLVASSHADVTYSCRKSTDAALSNNKGDLQATFSRDWALSEAKRAGVTPNTSGYPRVTVPSTQLDFTATCANETVYEYPLFADGKTSYPSSDALLVHILPHYRVYYNAEIDLCGIGMFSGPNSTGVPHLCNENST
ncbi:hypothetical protein ASPZODRAFT_166994 [Penicilliopsis zonata CBS 506.65]|uniref:AA1-like domain-containing protein n=1 Tax=Penicilliopsis zonata CBS 506.65 TaxID=1073090 RepID=A0A1L9SI65_9EURO|nr:hypothetical protein ASPZODRAFT_166994 [Penicilliopsis zonata CBS 506.65]OJJ46796.1 hypothetical protein ASPZODRAFT_166994 [Penicilliopsis zonata CBS 506.65]